MKVAVAPAQWDMLFAPSSCLAVITSVDGHGRENAATFGTCTRVCHAPVHLAFTVGLGKDTERNVRRTGEFTVNLPAADRGQLALALAAGDRLGPGISELEAAGMIRQPGEVVAAPRIGDFPRHLECRVQWTRAWLDRVMVVGEVVAASCDDGVLDAAGELDWDRARPTHYCGSGYGDRFVAAHEVIAVERGAG